MLKILISTLSLFVAAVACAQDRQFLQKPDVEALTTGKRWSFVRETDNQNIRWELWRGNRLFGANLSTNQRDAGSWNVNELGHLCVNWRGTSENGCWALFKAGTATRMTNARDLTGPARELAIDPLD